MIASCTLGVRAPATSAVPVEALVRERPSKSFFALDETELSLGRIRKTSHTPLPSVSVLDVISAATGLPRTSSLTVWRRLQESHPDITTRCWYFKFSGNGRRWTPVADAPTILEIVMLLWQAAIALRML